MGAYKKRAGGELIVPLILKDSVAPTYNDTWELLKKIQHLIKRLRLAMPELPIALITDGFELSWHRIKSNNVEISDSEVDEIKSKYLFELNQILEDCDVSFSTESDYDFIGSLKYLIQSPFVIHGVGSFADSVSSLLRDNNKYYINNYNSKTVDELIEFIRVRL